jgi:hypothetical protein
MVCQCQARLPENGQRRFREAQRIGRMVCCSRYGDGVERDFHKIGCFQGEAVAAGLSRWGFLIHKHAGIPQLELFHLV